jgi:hypothetical protein
MDPMQKKISFTNVGKKDHLPYAKADIVKVSRVSDNVSLSFYQLDYQAMAVTLAAKGIDKDHSDLLIPVGKIVIDKQTFLQFYDEMTQIIKITGLEVKEII